MRVFAGAFGLFEAPDCCSACLWTPRCTKNVERMKESRVHIFFSVCSCFRVRFWSVFEVPGVSSVLHKHPTVVVHVCTPHPNAEWIVGEFLATQFASPTLTAIFRTLETLSKSKTREWTFVFLPFFLSPKIQHGVFSFESRQNRTRNHWLAPLQKYFYS